MAAQAGGGDAPAIARRSRHRRGSHLVGVVAQHPVDDRGVGGRIALGDEIPRDAVVDEVPQPADVGRDHRRAARRGFQRDETEGLGARRDHAHVGGAVVVGELVVRLRRDEPHAALEPEVGDQRVQRCDLGLAVGTTGAADDHERGPVLVERRRARAPRGRRPSVVAAVRRTGRAARRGAPRGGGPSPGRPERTPGGRPRA